MSVSVDWKPERAVQEKIRDKKKLIILIDWKPERAIYAKFKDHDKVTASVRHSPLGASSYQKTSDSKHLQIKDSEHGHSKLLGRITVIVFNVPFPYNYHFPNFFNDPWSHTIGRPPLNSSNLSPCPFIWNSHLFYLQNFFYFWWQCLKQKFSKYKFF